VPPREVLELVVSFEGIRTRLLDLPAVSLSLQLS